MIKKLANLSKLTISKKEEKYFTNQFEETFKIIDQLESLDTSKAQEIYMVTGTKNVLRDDKIDPSNILSQKQALSGAKNTHNGYFVVDPLM